MPCNTSHKIVIIDNYDSFTYNLVHLVEKIIDDKVTILLNDTFELEELESYTKIILSPGPGLPKQAGKTMQVIDCYKSTKSILGVCLGHQAIGEYFGANLQNLPSVYHGIASNITTVINNDLFKNIEQPITVGRYHSWVINKSNLPNCLQIIAVDDDKNIMAIQHNNFNIVGVQFHPESVMTNCGEQLVKNWLEL